MLREPSGLWKQETCLERVWECLRDVKLSVLWGPIPTVLPFIGFGLWIQCWEKQIWNVISRLISLFFILLILFGSPVPPPSLPSVAGGVFLGQLLQG